MALPRWRRYHAKGLVDVNSHRIGAHFITFVLRRREHLLSTINRDEVTLLEMGKAFERSLCATMLRHAAASVDCHVVMPDHVHLILQIGENSTIGLERLVGEIKGASARRMNELWRTTGPIWRRGYHRGLLASAEQFERARRYIANNPSKWATKYSATDTGFMRAPFRAPAPQQPTRAAPPTRE